MLNPWSEHIEYDFIAFIHKPNFKHPTISDDVCRFEGDGYFQTTTPTFFHVERFNMGPKIEDESPGERPERFRAHRRIDARVFMLRVPTGSGVDVGYRCEALAYHAVVLRVLLLSQVAGETESASQ